MKAGQKSNGSNGLQNSLFPMDVMWISQGSDGDFSHKNSKAIDYIHLTKAGKRTMRAPVYAPADVTCSHVSGTGAGTAWTTDKEVNTPIGKTRVTYMVWHDNDSPNRHVGEKRKQGEVMVRTGTAGFVTGDHLHLEVYKGTTMHDKSQRVQNWELVFINDTELVKTNNYPWRTTEDSTGSINGSCEIGDGTITLNDRVNGKVLSYKDAMQKECDAQGIGWAVPYLLALMMTESEGAGGDPMQSSESQGWPPNYIKDPMQSIHFGVKHFKEAWTKSQQYKVDVWTTFQEYNFGIGYSKYIGERGGVNTIELAEWYSMNRVSPHKPPIRTPYSWEGAKAVGKPYRWKDGGNFHYANRVKWYTSGDGSVNPCGEETGVTEEDKGRKKTNNIIRLLLSDQLNGWR
ncbi:endolysin [Bacillus phage VMY22]|uniref:Morphogenesis protein n=1 Tax=Bacillus phage VMY22 TaxID=1734382 RepID=A0A0N9SIT8_9CAUD|nr:endolysin [Bacillus phage VMY22]ALH46483.1 morphogenesis protein [Bacillus phage VMY22]